MLEGIGLGILIVGAALLALSGLAWLITHYSFKQAPVHDGIGGRDTNNLVNGCVYLIVFWFFLWAGVFFAVVGGIVLAVNHFMV